MPSGRWSAAVHSVVQSAAWRRGLCVPGCGGRPPVGHLAASRSRCLGGCSEAGGGAESAKRVKGAGGGYIHYLVHISVWVIMISILHTVYIDRHTHAHTHAYLALWLVYPLHPLTSFAPPKHIRTIKLQISKL